MKLFAAVLVSAVVVGAAWGLLSGARPAALRTDAIVPAVGADWYAALPAEPEAATQAYLKRIPASARARGDAFGATRYITFPFQIAVIIGSALLILFAGVASRMRDLARRISSVTPLQDALFGMQLFVVLFLLQLPLETYTSYVRFREAGFSDVPYLQWLSDLTLQWGVDTVFYIVGLTAIMALIRRRQQSWAAWATMIYVALAATYVLITPLYIEPLFNRLEALVDGPQKQAILSLARANGVPADNVFVRDASRQGTLLDAHVSGFAGSAKIVLDDNTIANTSESETMMVMAHEIGHYVLAHVVKEIVFDGLVMGLGFLLIAWVMRRLISSFGSRWQILSQGDIGVLPVLWGLFVLWGYLSMPLTNGITREQEIEADLYGLNASQQPFGLAEYMIRDADTWQLDPSPVEEWIFYQHPSPRKRILSAMTWRAEHLTNK